jgi:hypothetical protein
MPAIMSLGLGGALPGDPTKSEVLDHLAAFAAYDFITNFFEIVDGELYEISRKGGETKITLVHPEETLPGWSPYQCIERYTYPEWYQAMFAAWNSRPGGDITYRDWSKVEYSVFVPFYEGRSRWVSVPPLTDKLGVIGVEAGICIGQELDLPSYFIRTLDMANEFAFLARISG